MSFKYHKLKGRIIEKYGNLRAFAMIAGFAEPTVYAKMSGKIGFNQEDIIAWASLLDINPSDYAEYFFCLDSQHNANKYANI